jgi:hypothetical protein
MHPTNSEHGLGNGCRVIQTALIKPVFVLEKEKRDCSTNRLLLFYNQLGDVGLCVSGCGGRDRSLTQTRHTKLISEECWRGFLVADERLLGVPTIGRATCRRRRCGQDNCCGVVVLWGGRGLGRGDDESSGKMDGGGWSVDDWWTKGGRREEGRGRRRSPRSATRASKDGFWPREWVGKYLQARQGGPRLGGGRGGVGGSGLRLGGGLEPMGAQHNILPCFCPVPWRRESSQSHFLHALPDYCLCFQANLLSCLLFYTFARHDLATNCPCQISTNLSLSFLHNYNNVQESQILRFISFEE